jgi:membrane-associated phospholipid phosphatase
MRAAAALGLMLGACGAVHAAESDDAMVRTGLLADVEDYVSAPVRWRALEWSEVAGTLALTVAAHHYDTRIRSHFTAGSNPIGGNTHDLADYAPAAVVLGGTWLYARWIDDHAGRREAWDMAEAAGLGVVTDEVLKYAAGRERPNETADPNLWHQGSTSFPSNHVTVAFAIGTVLAESGGEDYRWIRRFLGYGLGFGTAYERLNHNAHWLSDEVVSAALGTATAFFVMNRDPRAQQSGFSLLPMPGGAMLTYQRSLGD